MCAPNGCGSCLLGRLCHGPAGAGVHRAAVFRSDPPDRLLSSSRVSQEAGIFVSPMNLGEFVQNPTGCPTRFSGSLCSLRDEKEAKDGRPNPVTKNKSLPSVFSHTLSMSPLGGPAGAGVDTCPLKRYQWCSFIHS